MKLSIALFIIFMLFASLLPKKKCDCDATLETKYFLNDRLKYTYSGSVFEQTVNQKEVWKYHVDGKIISSDSISITAITK